MKTFGDLTEVQSLENNAVIPANNAADTESNKITFANLKAQILGDLSDAMIFKGTLGSDGTISSLPAAASSGTNRNTGFAYKVITAGTYQGLAAKVGDMLISNGNAWVLIPSGDDEAGTVTSVGLTEGTGIDISGGPITTSGSITVSHEDTSDQSSVSNTGRTYIQSITLDGMGHVTGISSATETVVDTDTHYASGIVVGASSSATSDATATNGNVTVNHIENSAVTDSHTISGSGTVSVTSDSSGNITVTGSDTNTHYASATIVAATDSAKIDAAATNGNVYLNHVENDVVTSSHKITGSGTVAVTSDSSGVITITGSDTNTHYTSGIVVGASNVATADAVATNGNVYLNHIENSAITDSHKITGSGGITVSSDASGVITINAAAATSSYDSEGTDPVNGVAVAAALATLPEPMVFKGSLGTGGTITTLPVAASSGASKNTGFVYKVIEAGTYQSKVAQVGDTMISTGAEWVVIPSGDEPSGTVTSVGLTEGTGISVSGGPVTSSGSITVAHADTSDQSSVSNSGRTYVQSITLDDMGHVTAISSATETVVDTDTHYASETVVGASSSATSDAAATNGNVYLNHIENSTVVSAHNIVGTGGTTVTSDANGVITIDSVAAITPASIGFGYTTCATAEATAAKTADLTGYELAAGGIVVVKFTYAVGASATLSINSKTAKPIFYNGSAITAGIIDAGSTASMMYDGTNYNVFSIIPVTVSEFDGGSEGEASGA